MMIDIGEMKKRINTAQRNWLLPNDEQIVLAFTFMFSRMEYALKEAGFLTSSDFVKADWERFAGELSEFLNASDDETRDAISYLERCPPERQVIRGRQLDWEEVNQEVSQDMGRAIKLFRSLRRIRNNLLHGGKMPFRPTRDIRLLQAGISLMTASLAEHAAIREKFMKY
ncbi:MAG: hypothetical protein ACP5O6_09750 [Candidatus Baltobacteraceae bacterium]